MDFNGNKYEDKDEDDFNEWNNTPNVRSLKLFFQKQPIIGFKPLADNRLESSTHSNESKDYSLDSSNNTVNNRSIRQIPRPPKTIQSCDIKVPPFLKSLVSNECERNVESMSSAPPIPKPRKSLQKYKSADHSEQGSNFEAKANIWPTDNLKNISDSHLPTNSLIESLNKEFKALNTNERIHRTSSQFLPKTPQTINYNICEPKADVFNHTTDQTVVAIESTAGKQNGNKSKKPFKSLMRSKLLRRFSDNQTEKQRIKKNRKMALNSNASQFQKPVKPTRKAPDPPKLNFRPPAPLPPPEPNEDYYEDTLTMSSEFRDNRQTNGYELYNDSVECEQIYCSLDNEDDDQNDSDIYEGIDDYDDGLTHRSDQTYICDNYYEDNSIDDFSDCERIYEVLPFERDSDSNVSNGSTISLDDNLPETNGEVKCEEMAKCEQKYDTFDRKRNLKAIKLKKKFNLNGNEIPVNAGIVKEDHRGNRYDLLVRKGETVLILRMEANPPGKWLAKNERSKIGFVDLDNISFDAESVKCIIKTLATQESRQ